MYLFGLKHIYGSVFINFYIHLTIMHSCDNKNPFSVNNITVDYIIHELKKRMLKSVLP